MSEEAETPEVTKDHPRDLDRAGKAVDFGEGLKRIFSDFLDDLGLGYERGTAIATHATLEEAMRAAIETVFVSHGECSKKLIGGDESPGELGFADQCRLAHCLGIIGSETLSDLKILSKVRNRFAHGEKGMTFEDQRIRDFCASLKIVARIGDCPEWRTLLEKRRIYAKNGDARIRYLASATLIEAGLKVEARHKTPTPLSGPRLLT